MAERILTAESPWSFSKLSCFDECPYAFYLQYMQDPPLPQQGNAWSDYGTLVHEILEEWAQGKLKDGELAQAFDERYDRAMVHAYPPFPKGYEEKSRLQAMDYFTNFKGFGEPGQFEVVSAEEKFTVKIGSYNMVGISDLVLRDTNTGKLTVIDHKTKSPNSMKHDRAMYTNQLYIYALHVHQKYGEWPERIAFNMIKDGGTLLGEMFDEAHLQKTLEWAEETIDNIYLEDDWIAKRAEAVAAKEKGAGSFYCEWICPVYGYCQRAQDVFGGRG